MLCRHCKSVLPSDFESDFCDACWQAALHGSDKAAELSILRWIARIDD